MIGFMDYLTFVVPSKTEAAQMLKCLERLFMRCCLKFKPSLRAIEMKDLPGKHKAHCYQFGLLLRVVWQIKVYEMPFPPVERFERKIGRYIRKWLGVSRSFATNALFTSSF